MIDLDIEAIVAPYRQALRPEGDPVAFTIPNVPASLTREQLGDWFAGLGIDLADIPKGSTIELQPDGLTIEVFARHPEGFINGRHRVVIPIIDEDPSS